MKLSYTLNHLAAISRLARTALSGALLFMSMLFAASAQASLSLHMQVNPDPIEAGSALAVQLTISNTDAVARTGVTVTMEYPANLNDLTHSAISDGGTCAATVSNNGACDSTEILTWNLGTIPANSSTSVDMPPVVAAATPAGTTITFAPSVTDDSTDVAMNSASALVVADRTLELSFYELVVDPVAPDSSLTYVLKYGHSELSAVAINTTLQLPVPAGLTFVSASDGGTLTGGDTVEWSLGTLTPGAGGERRATFTTSAGLTPGGVIEAEAVIQDSGGSSTHIDLLTRIADEEALTLVVDANPSPAEAGDTLAVKMTISNTSTFDRSGVTVQMRYPGGLNDLTHGAISDGGTCSASVSNNGACDSKENLTWILGTVPAQSTVSIDMPPRISTALAAGNLVQFTAEVRDDFANDSIIATQAVRIIDERALVLAVAETGADPAIPGTELTYLLTYGHRALSSVALNTQLTLQVPAGLNFVSADNGGTLQNGEVQWNLNNLNPGEGGERRAVFAVDAGVTLGTVLKVESSMQDNSGDIARADTSTQVAAANPLTVAIDANPNPAEPGDQLDVRMIVSNTSVFDRSGVTLRMRYPLQLADLGHGLISDGGTCSASVSNNGACDSTEQLTWNLGTVKAGSAIAIDMPPLISNSVVPGNIIVFEAEVEDAFADVAVKTTDSVLIASQRSLVLELNEVAPEPALPGEEIGYVVAFGYRALSAVALNTMITLPVPDGLTFLSADGGGTLAGNVVQWPLGILTPGTGGERRVLFGVDAQSVLGSAIKLEAVIADSDGDTARADAITRIENDIPLSVQVDVNPAPVQPGEVTNIELTVSNISPFDRSGITLQMRYPRGLASISHGLITDGGTCFASVSNNGACDSREVLTFNLGTVEAGSGISVNLPAIVSGTIAAGDIVTFVAEVQDSFADVAATTRETVRIVSDRTLELAIHEAGLDPVQPGGTLTYVLSVGQSALSALSMSAMLELPTPEGLTFVSATGGGVHLGDTVQWSLGNMAPGTVSMRRATFTVSPQIDAGSAIKAEATISDSDGEIARADTVTRAEVAAPLQVNINAGVNPALPGETLNVELTVSNTSPFDRAAVVLRMRYALNLNSLLHAEISDGGVCAPGISNNGRCDSREILTWNLGTVPANSEVTVSLPPVISSTLGLGHLLDFAAVVEDATARSNAVDVLRVGNSLDADNDGIGDSFDNCMLVDNPDQRDTNGDGYGNICDPDLDNNGVVNFGDVSMWVPAFNTANTGDEDFNGDGFANFGDYAIFPAFFQKAPGPSGIAP